MRSGRLWWRGWEGRFVETVEPSHVLQTLPQPPNHQRARGAASIDVVHDGTRTRLRDLRQSGCSKLRLPRRAGNAVEAVLINSSGGLTGGDRIAVDIDVGPNAALDVTTQACERAYRSSAGSATVDTRITVADGASTRLVAAGNHPVRWREPPPLPDG